MNEHICSTALYYYDCENVTDSHLAFRLRIDDVEARMHGHEQVCLLEFLTPDHLFFEPIICQLNAYFNFSE